MKVVSNGNEATCKDRATIIATVIAGYCSCGSHSNKRKTNSHTNHICEQHDADDGVEQLGKTTYNQPKKSIYGRIKEKFDVFDSVDFFIDFIIHCMSHFLVHILIAYLLNWNACCGPSNGTICKDHNNDHNSDHVDEKNEKHEHT